MKKFSFLLIAAAFVGIINTADAALDFSVFQTRGYEGKGDLEFNQPEDIILAPDGNYCIADFGNNRIQVIDKNGDFVKVLPPPKPKNEALNATEADDRPQNLIQLQNSFKRPVGLAFDTKGFLYCTLSTSDKIAVLDYKTGKVVKVIGNSGKKQGELWMPMDIDIDSQDRIAVAEYRNKRVQILSTEGECLKEIIYQEENARGYVNFVAPRGVFWTPDGDLIVLYPNYNQAVCWNVTDGSIRWSYAGGKSGAEKGELNNPSFACLGPDSHVMISDTKNHRIVELTRDGKFNEHHSRKGSGPGKLNTPRGLFLTKDENMIVCDQGNCRIQIFQPGQATIYLKEAKDMALVDDWNGVMANVEKILYLQPNNEQAMDLMVNALYYFGNKAFDQKDFDKAEEYYRRVLRYRPDDANIPQKLDAIFWENNKPLIIKVVAVVLGIIGLFILSWILKLIFRRLVRKVKQAKEEE